LTGYKIVVLMSHARAKGKNVNIVATVALCPDKGCNATEILSGHVEFRLADITQSLLQSNNYFIVSGSAFTSDTHK
jgi:hypothetical protein